MGGPRGRTKDDTAHHLDWFFNEAQGAVSGLRSSWDALSRAGDGVYASGVSRADLIPANRLEAARRETNIAARLEKVAPFDRIVLSLAFRRACPWHFDAESRSRLGDRFALVPLTDRARSAFSAALRKLERRAPDDARELVLEGRAATWEEMGDASIRIAAWRRGDASRARIRFEAMLGAGIVPWLCEREREGEPRDCPAERRGAFLREAAAEARLLYRTAMAAWEAVAPRPDASGSIPRAGMIRRAAASGPIVAIDLHPPMWEEP